MPLWVDKYRPSSLDHLDFHDDLSDQLRELASSNEFPHTLVYGPSGAGKKTRVMAVLKELFGTGAEKMKIDQKTFSTPSGKKLELNIVSSNYHIEVTPGDVGMYDRVVIQQIIKEIAQTQQVDVNAKKPFKVVVLNEADSLTRDAQHALRRTMEKYMRNLRVIMVCTSTSKILAPIRSRCFLVRVAAPTDEQICQVLQKVATKEKVDLPDPFAQQIAQKSEGNLRKALLMFETAKNQCYPFQQNQQLAIPDWEGYIHILALSMIHEQSPTRLMDVRTKFYELLSHCIPADVILLHLVKELIENCDDTMKREVIDIACEYEHRMRKGSKAIFHLEAFAAKFMSIYKRFLMELGTI